MPVYSPLSGGLSVPKTRNYAGFNMLSLACEISHENIQDLPDCLALQYAAYKNEPYK